MKPLTIELIKKQKKNLTIGIDLDGVIAIHPKNTKIDYIKYSKPDKELIKILHKLIKNGHKIVIFTARTMRRYNHNIGAVIGNYEETLKWLRKNKVPYSEIWLKPCFSRFYDDIALNYNRNDMINDLKGILNVK